MNGAAPWESFASHHARWFVCCAEEKNKWGWWGTFWGKNEIMLCKFIVYNWPDCGALLIVHRLTITNHLQKRISFTIKLRFIKPLAQEAYFYYSEAWAHCKEGRSENINSIFQNDKYFWRIHYQLFWNLLAVLISMAQWLIHQFATKCYVTHPPCWLQWLSCKCRQSCLQDTKNHKIHMNN